MRQRPQDPGPLDLAMGQRLGAGPLLQYRLIRWADNFVAIALFNRLNEAWLRTFQERPHGLPSHDTFGRVFAHRDADPLADGFRAWVQSASVLTVGQVVPIDGKYVRGSHDPDQNLGPRHRVSAWAHTHRLVRAQTAVDRKSHEITALPRQLRQLCLQGCLVTRDARGCPKAIAHPSRELEADSVLGVKKNPKGIYDRLTDTFALERATHFADCPHDSVTTVAKAHGRIEIRRGWVLGDPASWAYVDPHRDGRDW